LLCATAIIGLAASPTDRRLIAMAVLAGLAAAGKFHFGIWLGVSLLSVWGRPAHKQPILWSGLILVTFACVIIALVPWFWLDAPLALKELLGVVGVKLVGETGATGMTQSVATIISNLGVVIVSGVIAGLVSNTRRELMRLISVLIPLVLGTVALTLSGIVFDRYVLVLYPGAVLLASIGWEHWLSAPRASLRNVGAAALAIGLASTLVALWDAERMTGEADVDVLARNWILKEVPTGSRIAIQDETNAVFPRSEAQLRACASFVATPAAYARKWAIEGFNSQVSTGEPMRAMLLTDEEFSAYWCRRELGVRSGLGYYVVRYHEEPRFDAVLERDAVKEFRTGSHDLTGGIDVLVMNREIDASMRPAAVISTARGRRVIYRR
jgi:hypothetical protein